MKCSSPRFRTLFASACVWAFGAAGVFAAELESPELKTPELRDGAQICDVDPATGLRSVILPALWTEISEINVTYPAYTDLIHLPAIFNADGTLNRPAVAQERLAQTNGAEAVKRQIVFYPESVMQINAAGEFVGGADKIEREAYHAAIAKEPNLGILPYEQTQDRSKLRFNAYVERQKRLQKKFFQNVKRENSVSTHISYPTEAEVVAAWEAYALQYDTQNAFYTKICQGAKPVDRLLRLTSLDVSFEDIGVKVPRIETLGAARKFNIYGAELE